MSKQKRTLMRRSARGMALIEALVGILIFAFGILGLLGLQAAMTKAQGSAKSRADATNLASEVLGLMWADRGNLDKYNAATCSTYAPCKEWSAKVASLLPAGGATVVYPSPVTGGVDVTLTWTPPAEGTHTYAISTFIR
jgi:type IV pilus assembly protein PilV